MNQHAIETFARGYVTGFFDVVAAMLSQPVPNAVAAIKSCGPDETGAYLAKYNALVRAQIGPDLIQGRLPGSRDFWNLAAGAHSGDSLRGDRLVGD